MFSICPNLLSSDRVGLYSHVAGGNCCVFPACSILDIRSDKIVARTNHCHENGVVYLMGCAVCAISCAPSMRALNGGGIRGLQEVF